MLNTNLAEDRRCMQYTESDAIQALKVELEKGIDSMKQERLYTIEEAWEEIDSI